MFAPRVYHTARLATASAATRLQRFSPPGRRLCNTCQLRDIELADAQRILKQLSLLNAGPVLRGRDELSLQQHLRAHDEHQRQAEEQSVALAMLAAVDERIDYVMRVLRMSPEFSTDDGEALRSCWQDFAPLIKAHLAAAETQQAIEQRAAWWTYWTQMATRLVRITNGYLDATDSIASFKQLERRLQSTAATASEPLTTPTTAAPPEAHSTGTYNNQPPWTRWPSSFRS
jgi:hypothetical protein